MSARLVWMIVAMAAAGVVWAGAVAAISNDGPEFIAVFILFGLWHAIREAFNHWWPK